MAWNQEMPQVINKARLMSKSPDSVYQELEEYGAYHLENRYLSGDETTELALLKRPDRLIRLGLAQYGMSSKVGQALYQDACSPGGETEYKEAIRLAVLSNPRFPISDFTFDAGFGALNAEQLARAVKEGGNDVLNAIATNPGGHSMLSRIFNRKEPFDSLELERYLTLLHFSSRNPSLTLKEDSEDGPDFVALELQKGLWNLVKTLPVSSRSLEILYELLININPGHARSPEDDPRPMFQRWKNFQITEGYKHRDYLRHTGLEFRDEFICLVASLYGRVHADHFTTLGSLNDPDQVMRCCYYGHTTLKGKDLQAAYDRDKDVFIFALMQNISMPRSPEVKVLVENNIGSREMIMLYHKRLKQSHERWDGEAKPATEDGAELMEKFLPRPPDHEIRLQALVKQVEGVSKQVSLASSFLRWILVAVVVTLILVLRK